MNSIHVRMRHESASETFILRDVATDSNTPIREIL